MHALYREHAEFYNSWLQAAEMEEKTGILECTLKRNLAGLREHVRACHHLPCAF